MMLPNISRSSTVNFESHVLADAIGKAVLLFGQLRISMNLQFFSCNFCTRYILAGRLYIFRFPCIHHSSIHAKWVGVF